MECWDAYDRDFKKVQGVTLIRGEKVPENCFHLVCDIIVTQTSHTQITHNLYYRPF